MKAKYPLSLLALATMALVAPPGAAGTVYQWTDPSGVVHYSSSPPPQVEQIEAAEVRRFVQPSTATDVPDALSRELERIERQIEQLRDLRAAKLGISREALDQAEGRATRYPSSERQPEAPQPQATEPPTDYGELNEQPYPPVYPPPWYRGGPYVTRHPYYAPETSDAFRPPVHRPPAREYRRHLRDPVEREERRHGPRHKHREPIGKCCTQITGE